MERQNTEEVSMTMPSVSNNLDLVFDDEQRERTVNMHFTFTFRVPPPLSIPTYATPSEPRPLPKRKADNELTHASLKARFPNIVSEPMFFSPSSALTTIDEFKTRLQARSPPATSGYSVKIEDHCVPLFKSPGSETFVDFWYRYNEEVKNNRPKMLLSSSTPQKFHTSPVAKILLDASEGAPVPIDGKTFECSHLCDTSACVRVSHVRWEDKDVSYARRSCFTNLSKHLLPLLDGVDTGISIQRFCINSIHADEPCDFARYIANEQLVVDTWMVYHDVDDLISVSPDTIGHVNSVSSLASSFRFASLSLDGDFLVPAKLVSLSVAASGKAAFTIADFHPFQGEERAILELSSTAQSNGQSTRDLYAQQSAARAHIGEWAGVDRADSKTAQTFVRPSIRQSTAVDQPMRQPDIDSNRWAALAKTQIDMAYRAHGIIKTQHQVSLGFGKHLAGNGGLICPYCQTALWKTAPPGSKNPKYSRNPLNPIGGDWHQAFQHFLAGHTEFPVDVKCKELASIVLSNYQLISSLSVLCSKNGWQTDQVIRQLEAGVFPDSFVSRWPNFREAVPEAILMHVRNVYRT